MEIVYKNTFKDIFIFMFYYLSKSPISLIISPIIALLFFPWSSFTQINIGMIIVLILWILLFYTLYLFFSLLLMLVSSVFKKDKSFLTNHKITLNDDNLIEETKYGTSIYKWEAIHRMKENKNYLFIYVSPSSAHIIPKKTFSSSDNYKLFFNFIKNKINIKN